MKNTLLINNNLLDDVTRQANNSARLRMNFNLHDSYESNAQKVINAMEPGTVVPIHRHKKFAETYVVLRGSIRVFFYNDKKTIIGNYLLDPNDGNYGIEIPLGVLHNLEVIEPGTVIFEVKDGPYIPSDTENIT